MAVLPSAGNIDQVKHLLLPPRRGRVARGSLKYIRERGWWRQPERNTDTKQGGNREVRVRAWGWQRWRENRNRSFTHTRTHIHIQAFKKTVPVDQVSSKTFLQIHLKYLLSVFLRPACSGPFCQSLIALFTLTAKLSLAQRSHYHNCHRCMAFLQS